MDDLGLRGAGGGLLRALMSAETAEDVSGRLKGLSGCLWGYVHAFRNAGFDTAVGEEIDFEESGCSEVVLAV